MEFNGQTEPTSQPPSQYIENMLMTIFQDQESLNSLILSLKEDVEQLKLTPSQVKTLNVPKVSQLSATKPDQTLESGHSQSDPPPFILTPKRTIKPKFKKTPLPSLLSIIPCNCKERISCLTSRW
ncbi:hypothetical protein O181_104037 [Austropuccinia psidii MF-1]|uniref:Uncharacterized protein n=1 Tax=Austropuccinia psidii MF-1 TaxID=1389203 RepID=A0A9Q3PL14_9BASI|nr:hypothetical protein [Austropuccinia psidii MF-1]